MTGFHSIFLTFFYNHLSGSDAMRGHSITEKKMGKQLNYRGYGGMRHIFYFCGGSVPLRVYCPHPFWWQSFPQRLFFS